MTGEEGADDLPEEDREIAYGSSRAGQQFAAAMARKTGFKPWHHPVKQIVRSRQWADLTVRLLTESRPAGTAKLHYFTLPGPDLLDVRVLSDACHPLGVEIEYFGFDAAGGGYPATAPGAAPWATADAGLRQAGRVGAGALILPDRLEDIAEQSSQAASQLGQRPPFDVINIDACDHLAYCPHGRTTNTFDALQALLGHQLHCRQPWLLFLTTRAEPGLLGSPQIAFQQAISQNLGLGGDFGSRLAETLAADAAALGSAMTAAWGSPGPAFLKLYSVGIAKFLLQFFHGQPSLPANVELASCYAYRVYGEEPDMLALAFRITPDPARVFPPAAGGAAVLPSLEPQRAARAAARAARLQDLDHALEQDEQVRAAAVSGTEQLLAAANYDVAEWRSWLAGHVRRPLHVA